MLLQKITGKNECYFCMVGSISLNFSYNDYEALIKHIILGFENSRWQCAIFVKQELKAVNKMFQKQRMVIMLRQVTVYIHVMRGLGSPSPLSSPFTSNSSSPSSPPFSTFTNNFIIITGTYSSSIFCRSHFNNCNFTISFLATF
ncbi:unnamed protein product [Cunninghamella echinulata]